MAELPLLLRLRLRTGEGPALDMAQTVLAGCLVMPDLPGCSRAGGPVPSSDEVLPASSTGPNSPSTAPSPPCQLTSLPRVVWAAPSPLDESLHSHSELGREAQSGTIHQVHAEKGEAISLPVSSPAARSSVPAGPVGPATCLLVSTSPCSLQPPLLSDTIPSAGQPSPFSSTLLF